MSVTKIPTLFPITIFEQLDTNGPITKARARVFYKYLNRNGGYITDAFADHLLSTLPGSPIKGIYDEELGDYTDHGKNRQEGKAYGFVPETNHNISYEEHLDEDGVVRTYACADVYLWTSLYDEAIDIVGSAQSMELHEPSVKGTWKIIDGKRLFEYTEGSFLGLQVLGKNTEPCFEGAAFFSLLEGFPQEFLNSLYESYLEIQSKSQEGGQNMKKLVYELSDGQKHYKLFQALNEDGLRYFITEVYDNYAIVLDIENESFGRIAYEKDNDAETVTVIGEIETVYAEYLTESEKDTLAVLRKLQTTYEAGLEDLEQLQTQLAEEVQKNEESVTTISTLIQEREVVESSLNETKQLVEELQTEVGTLVEYKLGIERAAKEVVLSNYAGQLGDKIISDYKEKIDEFSLEDLEKELAFALVKSNPSFFSQQPGYIPKDQEVNGLSAVLDKYKKN